MSEQIDDGVEARVQKALRALQILDEITDLGGPRREFLIEAETALGEALGLVCTGEPGAWLADGTVVAYDHNENTCPVHEWLYREDAGRAEEILSQLRKVEA